MIMRALDDIARDMRSAGGVNWDSYREEYVAFVEQERLREEADKISADDPEKDAVVFGGS